MRVTILVSGMPPHHIGGTETQTENMARHLAKGGHKVTVLTRSVPGAPLEERRDGFVIKRFRYVNFPVLRFVSHAISSLMILRKLKSETDVLQCMMIKPNGFVGALAKKLFGYRYITWLRSEYRRFGKGKGVSGWIARVALKNSDMILTQTERIRHEVLEDYPEKRVIAIPNGIDMPDTRADGDTVVYVGTLSERKGVRELIMALQKLKGSGTKVPETIIVGDGPDRPVLEKMARGLPVKFAGRKMPHEVKKYMQEGMMLVLPSKDIEGMPNVVLEGMSMGLPVIATKVGGVPEMIDHGRTGFLADPGDPDDIAMYLKKLMGNPSLRSSMSRNCLHEIKKYEWGRIISKLENGVYKHLD